MVKTSTCKLYYNLNEPSGTVVTDSAGGPNGTASNLTVNSTGKLGTSYLFNGTNSSIASNLSFDFSAIDVSGFAWVYINSLAETSHVMNQTNGGSDTGWSLVVHSSGFLTYSISGVASYVDTSSPISTDTWHHIGFTRKDDDLLQLYVDGVAADSFSTSSGGQGICNLTVGSTCDVDSQNDMDGKIDELGIWLEILTPEDVASLYNNGVGLTYPFQAGVIGTGSRGNKELLTRFPETVGLGVDERHEGIQIGLVSTINHTPYMERVGLKD